MDEWGKMRAFLGLLAAGLFVSAGLQMIGLRSQSDERTVAELFDNYVGIACFGLAALSLIAGLPGRKAA